MFSLQSTNLLTDVSSSVCGGGKTPRDTFPLQKQTNQKKHTYTRTEAPCVYLWNDALLL